MESFIKHCLFFTTMARYKVNQKELTDLGFDILRNAYYGMQNFYVKKEVLSHLSPAETLALFFGAYSVKQREEFGEFNGAPNEPSKMASQLITDGYIPAFKKMEEKHGGVADLLAISAIEESLQDLRPDLAQSVIDQRLAPFSPPPAYRKPLHFSVIHTFKAEPFYDPNIDGRNLALYAEPLLPLVNQ